MPDSDNEIENRVGVLERQLLRLREDVALATSEAAAARVLAAGADHDVSEVRAELRAHTQALNALRETQLELATKVTDLDHKVTDLDHKVTEGFGTLAARMAQITALLTSNGGSRQS